MSLSAWTVSTREEFARLGPGWDELVAAMQRPSPFLLHGWLGAWCRHYAEDGQLRVHVVSDGDRLVGALPLFVERRHGLRVARFLGGGQSALADLLLAPDADAAVARTLLELAREPGYDYADLFGLPGNSNLSTLAPGAGLALVERVAAPVLDLTPGYDAVYRAKTTSKRRQEFKRRLRRLGELGPVRFEVARTLPELTEALEHAFRLHDLRWHDRPDGSDFTSPTGKRFHRDALTALAPLAVPRIVTLTVADEPVAFYYFFAFRGAMIANTLGFDPELARFGPGLMTTFEAIREGAAEGLRRVEFLGGDEPYKLELADTIQPLYQAIGLAPTLKGQLATRARRHGLVIYTGLRRSERVRKMYTRSYSLTRRVLARLPGMPGAGGRVSPAYIESHATAGRGPRRASP